jgi:IclR family acetate operon transcriptional repressor
MGETKQINTIHRSVAVLNILAQGISRLEDIHPDLGLSKSTTHRLLKSLVASGLAFQDPATRRYYLGPSLLRLASNEQIAHNMLVICVHAELIRLTELTRESSLIFVPCGVQRMVVKQIRSPLDVSFTFKEGHTSPLYLGSAGRILLSMMSKDQLEAVLANLELVRFGPNTITDKEVLRVEIEKARHQGFAMTFGETQAGTGGISVPVFNYACPAALCILGPEFRFSPLDALKELKKSGDRVSSNLLRIFGKTTSKAKHPSRD